MERPSYFLAHGIFDSHRLRVVSAPCDDDGLDPARLESLLASGELPVPKLLYLVPQHSNPRGTSLPLPRRQALVALAERFGFLLLCDDVYAMLSFPSAEPPPRLLTLDQAFRSRAAAPAAASSEEGHVLSLGSFTKILAPGLRLGWIEAAPPLVERISK